MIIKVMDDVEHISIHSPRAGRDKSNPGTVLFDNISIHSPRAGRDRKKQQFSESYFLHLLANIPLFIVVNTFTTVF